MNLYEEISSAFASNAVEVAQNDTKIPIDYETKPWKNNPQYFKKVYLSALAVIKMAVHAKAGGSIEVMGMMTGTIVKNAIMVNDVYPLPVEGTETRVNAQAEGYEYMVQYLECLKQVGRTEHIVGWYHSHPGYGCWLSGIDVATQSLNQNFQDPYLAVVVDPIKTMKQGKVEIGAFRTFPENHKHEGDSKEMGVHSDRYYQLEVEITSTIVDKKIIENIVNESWQSFLTQTDNQTALHLQQLHSKINGIVDRFRKLELQHPRAFEISRRFDSQFEEMINEILQDSRNRSKDESDDSSSDMEEDSEADNSSRRSYNSDETPEQTDDSRQRKRPFAEDKSQQKRLLSRLQKKAGVDAYKSTGSGMDALVQMAQNIGSAELQNLAMVDLQNKLFR